MHNTDRAPAEAPVEPLTRREREILLLLAQGHSGPEIAEKLTLALNSVKSHMQHLYAKLGVHRKHQALARAAELGLLTPTAPAAAGPGHNLPLQVTRFFGREAELAQVSDRLDENRLVTLTGSGGVGKTRLSLRVAEDALGEFADGVWLVELAPLSDPALVPRQVAIRLGLPDEPGRPGLTTVIDYLRPRQTLLVLDNAEHLSTACAHLANALLRACPALKILVTSRQPLGADGEAVFRVPSLPFPDSDQPLAPERLAEFPAARLFVDRARLVVPDYQLAAHNAAAIGRICRQLDGIPLALELAAARTKLLTAEQVAARLDDALGLLTNGRQTALPRQRTLQATIDWSFGLLIEPERLLLLRLSVFAGGCTLAAAEAIGSGDGLEAGQVLDLLTALVDKSLVLAERRQNNDTRYRLLETVRQFAWDKLGAAGAQRQTQARHQAYFLAFAETNVPKTATKERLVWERKLLDERDNFRRALEWSFSDQTGVETGPRLLNVLKDGYPWPSGQEWLDWAQRGVAWCQSHAGISDSLYVSLLAWATGPLAQNDLPTAVAWMREAVDISRRLGPENSDLLWNTLLGLANLHLSDRGDGAAALAPLAEAVAILEARGPAPLSPGRYEREMTWLETIKGELAIRQRRYEDAKLHAREAKRRFEVSGDHWSVIGPLLQLGDAYQNLREYEQARETFLEALALIEESGDGRKAYVLRCLGLVDMKQGHLERALEYCREGLHEAERIGDPNITATCLGVCAGIAAKAGQPERAARLSGAAKALYARQHRNAWEDSSLETLLPDWQEGPDQAVIAHAFAAGLAMKAEQAVALALDDNDGIV